jgi:hypothetical protein
VRRGVHVHSGADPVVRDREAQGVPYSNLWGQVGAGTVGTNNYVTPAAIFTPEVVKGIAGKPVAIAPAEFHACALLEGGGATCWGNNGSGQLGADPNLTPGGGPTPVPVIYEYMP